MRIHLVHKFFASLHKNGWPFFISLALASYILSIQGFISLSETGEFDTKMLIQAAALSFRDMPDDRDIWIFVAKMFWMITFASAAFSLFLREWSQKQLFDAIKEDNHTAIIGLGELSHNYINSLNKSSTIIYNNNSQNISSSNFSDKGFAIKEFSLEEISKELSLSSMYRALINTGNDRNNINMAFEIIETYLNKNLTNPLRLIVRIENRELNALFMSNKIFTGEGSNFKSSSIEIKTYSFFEECALKLFDDNFIDGEDNNISNSNEDYSIAIIGNGKLANKIIYEAMKVAHLPNENILNIHLVGINPEQFQHEIRRSYPYVENIPTIKLHTKRLDYKSLEFYKNHLWDEENLTNIIICHDDENTNLEISSSMQDKTFLQKENIKLKVLFGVFNQGSIAKKLDVDDENFKIFRSFGNAKEILTVDNLFDDKNHMIAKLVNYTYTLLANEYYETPYNPYAKFEYDKNKSIIDKHWFTTIFTDKTSSLAQAKHIQMKLKALDLRLEQSIIPLDKLLEHNRKVLDNKFHTHYKGNYPFPKNFDSTLFHKTIRLEHNRWNAYHYLNGWLYSNIKNKSIKKHDCLKPISDFPKYFTNEKRLIDLIEWDIYATMYIPNYLAEAKYIILDKKN